MDINAPHMSTLNIGNGEHIDYYLESASAISNFRYENSSDSIIFDIKPYSLVGGTNDFRDYTNFFKSKNRYFFGWERI